MDYLHVDEPAEGVLRLAMSQPGKKNALNFTMRTALHAAISRAAAEPRVKAVILTGAGGQFSAGGDIHGLMAIDKAAFRAYLKGGHEIVQAFWRLEKPLVAAIEGVGVGGGLALAMCADHIVMAQTAKVGFTFIKIGFVPDWGTPFTVPRRVGHAHARRLFQTGDLVDAAEAFRIGLVDELAAEGDVQMRAIGVAQELAHRPARAFALGKRLGQTLPSSLEAALELESMAQESCFKSDEFMAGTARFL